MGIKRNCWQFHIHRLLTAFNQERFLSFHLSFCSSDNISIIILIVGIFLK